jgi:hypothetical protein
MPPGVLLFAGVERSPAEVHGKICSKINTGQQEVMCSSARVYGNICEGDSSGAILNNKIRHC